MILILAGFYKNVKGRYSLVGAAPLVLRVDQNLLSQTGPMPLSIEPFAVSSFPHTQQKP